MSLAKQAKILSITQQTADLSYLSKKRHADRNTLMFLLSVDAGLRAKEIANITWDMVTDAEGELSDSINLVNFATKRRSGGIIYMSKRLQSAFSEYMKNRIASYENAVIRSQQGGAMTAQTVTNWFFLLYQELGFIGCSSHSGRRTAITTWARKIHSVGGSIRDVQRLARHRTLQMTERYIQISEDACRRVVG